MIGGFVKPKGTTMCATKGSVAGHVHRTIEMNQFSAVVAIIFFH